MTDFKTGDMLLFQGSGFISAVIMSLPSADFSHVAFYYEHPKYGPCVAESTSIGNDPDVKTGKIENGVQITKFTDRIANYGGPIFHRPLINPLTTEQSAKFDELVEFWQGVPYESDKWQLAKAQLDGVNLFGYEFPWLRNEQDESTMFCSEYVTRIVREIKISKQNSGEPTNETTPTNCSIWWSDVYQPVETDPIFIPS